MMLTILVHLIPVINIIMMAVWAFSSKKHSSQKSVPCFTVVGCCLIAYVVAMAVAGFTILDIVRLAE